MTYVDLIGRPLAVGDHVVYPTSVGSSPMMCVARIVDFNDLGKTKRRYDRQSRTVEEVAAWSVRLQPIHFNDYRSTGDYVDGERVPREPREVTVHKVENLVKVDL